MSRITDPKERAVAVDRAKEDFYFFTRWMFLERRGFKWLQGRHHQLICDALMRVFRGEITRLIINIPPRYSKTELLCMFVAWTMGHHPDSEYIYVSYSGLLSQEQTAKIRDIVLHPSYREIFPHVTLTKQGQSHWKTSVDGAVYGSGAEGTITGFGAGKVRPGFGGAIVIDDPIKPDEARSETIREGVNDWYMETLQSRVNSPLTPIILIMQRLHEKDLAGWALAGGSGEVWEKLVLPAIQTDGTALWPEKHDIIKLKQMRQASPYMFAGQYQQSPAPPEGNIFTPDMMPVMDAVPVGTKFVRGWDFAASEDDGDWTVGAKLGQMPDGRWVIANIVRLQGRPDQVEAALKNTADSDTKAVRISIPQDPGQAGKSQVAAFTKLLRGFVVEASPESGDKITRAEPLAAQVNVGNVAVIRAEWNEALKDEMRVFPNGTFDDQVDACARSFNAKRPAAAKVTSLRM